jgi:glutathione S-transferase
MPVVPDARIEISAFSWVPPFARGQVRDVRVRWALEEIGLPYRVRLLNAMEERPADYFREQPWGQVPIYNEGDIHLFESGAIVIHIGEKDERLLPRDAPGRARAIGWVVAALNSVDPEVGALTDIDTFDPDAEWARLRRPAVVERLATRLSRLADSLGEKDWLEGRFTIGDLMMIATLRGVTDAALLEAHPNLAAYVARGEARPAFQRALVAQFADFVAEPA